MGWNKGFTPEQAEHIEILASEGFGDGKISHITKVSPSVVGSITTDYWNKKMKAAHEWFNY